MASLSVTLLGTGSPIPDPNRGGAASLVRAGSLLLLVDCGRGVLMRLAADGVFPGMLSAVLLTHLHSDHVTDLNDVITTRWAMSPMPNPLTIFGPPGTRRLVDRTLAMLEDDIGYRIAHHDDLTEPPRCDVVEILDGTVIDRDGVHVTAAPTEHRPVHPTIGFRIDHDGASIVVAGDTVPCEGLDRLCAGADVYVQTTIRQADIEQIPSARLQDVLDYHSTIEMAAQTANRGGVRVLAMTHMVPPVVPSGEAVWIADAVPYFGGHVIVGHDLLRIDAQPPVLLT